LRSFSMRGNASPVTGIRRPIPSPSTWRGALYVLGYHRSFTWPSQWPRCGFTIAGREA
jgi:hypothetical protein